MLRLLLTIAETRRFGAAAVALGVTQPSISQQVRRIEAAAGCRLFHRTRRGVELTRDGEGVLVYARAVLRLTSDLKMRLAASTEMSEIAIGMSEDFCRTALPSVLRLFMIGRPHVRIRILSGTYDTLLGALERGEIDFTIMRRHDAIPEAETLYSEELAWIGGLGLELPVPDPVPLVLPLSPNTSRDTVLETLEAAGRPFVIRFESIGIAGIEMALGANLGVIAGPRQLPLLGAAPLAAHHGLPPLPIVEYVIVRSGRPTSDLSQAFAGILADAARSRFALLGEARASVLRLTDPASNAN